MTDAAVLGLLMLHVIGRKEKKMSDWTIRSFLFSLFLSFIIFSFFPSFLPSLFSIVSFFFFLFFFLSSVCRDDVGDWLGLQLEANLEDIERRQKRPGCKASKSTGYGRRRGVPAFRSGAAHCSIAAVT
jgi:hypothetical protein